MSTAPRVRGTVEAIAVTLLLAGPVVTPSASGPVGPPPAAPSPVPSPLTPSPVPSPTPSPVASPAMLSPAASPATPEAVLQSDVAFPASLYAERRARLSRRVGGAPVIVPGGYRVRAGGQGKQDPDFWYLTGVESPYSVLVMLGDGEGSAREVLFLPEELQFAGAQYPMEDPRFRRAAWNRTIRRLAPGPAAEAATGIDETLPIDELAARLADIVGDAETVWLRRDGRSLYAPPGMPRPRTVMQQLEEGIIASLPGRTIEDASPHIAAMRLVKDGHEVAALREAARVSSMGLREALAALRPGMNDLEVAGLMEYVWKRNGSPRASFAPIVASGDSAVSLYTLRSENYNAVDRTMQAGELLFIDYGAAEWATYTSDICRTYPVSGEFTDTQRRYYEIVLEAQEAALARVAPGVMMLDVIRAAADVYRDHGLAEMEDIDRLGAERVWGLMPSPTHYLERGGGLTDYSGARGTGVRDLGHHIGLEALDSRDYSMPLQPGMVFTVEPKIYIPELGIAIMIEDMILVTETGHENLSADAPKTVAEIEALAGSAAG